MFQLSVLEKSFDSVIISFLLITFRMHKWFSKLKSALGHLSLRGFCKVPPPAPKMVRILNVAEKNDAAKNIAEILSRGHHSRVSEPVTQATHKTTSLNHYIL